MVAKEFRELRRDRRTVAMMVVLPVLLLVVFGYAANFRVHDIPTVAVGPGASRAAALLHAPVFRVTEIDPAGNEATARARLRDGKAAVAVVASGARPVVLMDGAQLFSAETAQGALAELSRKAGGGVRGDRHQARRGMSPPAVIGVSRAKGGSA
jgi:ABC-2 type transport system permease protein